MGLKNKVHSYVAMLWHFAMALLIGATWNWDYGFWYFGIVGVFELVLYKPAVDK